MVKILKRLFPASRSYVEWRFNELNREYKESEEKYKEYRGAYENDKRSYEEDVKKWRYEFEQIHKEAEESKKEFSVIRKEIEKLEKINQDGCSDINKKLLKLDKIIPETRKDFAEMRALLNKVGQRYLYNNNYEREAISSFYDIYEREDFKDLFLRLIDGLEEDDVAKISLILQRQRLAKNSADQEVDLFTPEEQKQINDIKRCLSGQVFQVAEDMYCYRHYLLPIRHFEACVFYHKHGINSIVNLSTIRNRDILDIGGFIGDSILILKPLTDKHVISFEAVSENYELMKRTVEMNRLDNVILEKMALGSEQGEIEIELAGSSSSLTPNSAVKIFGKEMVQMDTLDSYIEHSELELDVGLIKVDIEGAEQDFMVGARKTIEKFRPVLLMSIYHNADDFFNIKPIIESWNLGYRFKIHKSVDFSVSREVLLIAEVR